MFADIVDDFLDFVGDGRLVIHNAPFDIGFLNSELKRLDKPLFKLEDAVDTLVIARTKYPGAQANLDALCHRFDIDTSSRGKHGALIDSILLAEVYVNLLGGKQSGWSFESNENQQTTSQQFKRKVRTARKFSVSDDELKAHREFIETLSNPMWNREGEKF